MELHSYAKRRPVKKWTVEQKRKLVETRITYDNWFTSKPTNSVAPWKKILAIAQLDDFNVFFVRKQWSNMIAKYRQLKQNRLGDTNTKLIDNDMICRLNQDWEFFEPIHKFMVRKTANLHSYALTEKGEDDAVDEATGGNTAEDADEKDAANNSNDDPETNGKRRKSHHSEDDQSPTNCKAELLMDLTEKDISTNIGMLVCGSNERIHELGSEMRDKKVYRIYEHVKDTTLNTYALNKCYRNTDGEFYSKPISKDPKMHECQCRDKGFGLSVFTRHLIHPLLDTPNQNENASLCDQQTSNPPNQTNVDDSNQQTNEPPPPPPTYTTQANTMQNINMQQATVVPSMPVTSPYNMLSTDEELSPERTEREKYYRRKRIFYRRLDKRITSVLQVVGEIIKIKYPNIDVSKLMESNDLNSNDSSSEYTTGS